MSLLVERSPGGLWSAPGGVWGAPGSLWSAPGGVWGALEARGVLLRLVELQIKKTNASLLDVCFLFVFTGFHAYHVFILLVLEGSD